MEPPSPSPPPDAPTSSGQDTPTSDPPQVRPALPPDGWYQAARPVARGSGPRLGRRDQREVGRSRGCQLPPAGAGMTA
eukprot:scaffold4840_cov115-Isochrysis_galbana.AAC.23